MRFFSFGWSSPTYIAWKMRKWQFPTTSESHLNDSIFCVSTQTYLSGTYFINAWAILCICRTFLSFKDFCHKKVCSSAAIVWLGSLAVCFLHSCGWAAEQTKFNINLWSCLSGVTTLKMIKLKVASLVIGHTCWTKEGPLLTLPGQKIIYINVRSEHLLLLIIITARFGSFSGPSFIPSSLRSRLFSAR